MRVLLTGGYGCIGSWIARNLIERGNEVWIYDLKEDHRRLGLVLDKDQLSKVHFVPGDVTDLSAFRSALETHAISHVIHLAGLQVPICRADPILGAKVNVVGTLVVFEAVRALPEQVRRLVYASSSAVYGPPDAYESMLAPQREPTLDELFLGPEESVPGLPDDAPLEPTTHYGVFKCCNEGNARIYYQEHRLSSIGLRPWTVYGVGRDFGMTSEPTKAIKSVALGRPYHVSYGGWQDLQLADDVAKTFIRCLEVPYEGAHAYNLRGAVVELPTFHEALREVAPEAARLITFGDKQLPIAYDLSDERLQHDLGPMPRTPLNEGIRRTLEHFKRLNAEGRLDTADLDAR